MKIILVSFFSIFFLFILFLAWAGYPWSLKEKKISPEIVHIEPKEMFDEDSDPSVIKILTWNLGFLYGKGSEGPGYFTRDNDYFQARLDQLVEEIKHWDPDVICFQEIDFDSSRSQKINQARYVAEKAGYPYVAEAISWDANYIPFPYWPVTNNFGGMKSGGAILSRYPLKNHEVTLLDKPASHPWWYNVFYLHRYFQKVTLEVGTKTFSLVNLHLEAFDKKDREKQINELIALSQNEKIDFIAGDFNMVPSSAINKSKFEEGDNYENDLSFDLMTKSGMLEVIPEEIYAQMESNYFTFPSWKPDRRLDYIFYQAGHKMMKAEILPSALSDHLPLRTSFQIDSPKVNPYSL